MTKLSRDDVLALAQLSGLQLADDEIDVLAKDIEEIIGYVNQLDELNTEGVEPLYQVTGLNNVFREDIVDNDAVSRETLLALAPEQLNNHIKVPKVL